MKIPCMFNQKPALIVGYVCSRRGKTKAIIICENKLLDVRLNKLTLEPEQNTYFYRVEVKDLDSSEKTIN